MSKRCFNGNTLGANIVATASMIAVVLDRE